MSTRLQLRTNHKARTNGNYPYDPAHPTQSYAQTQRDVGGALLIGAVVLVVLMALIVIGLA